EGSRRVVADRAAHADDAADVQQERPSLHVAVAGAQDDQLHRGAGRAECLLERGGRDEPWAAIGALKNRPCCGSLPEGPRSTTTSRWGPGSRRCSAAAPAVPWPLKWTTVGLSLRSSRSRSSGSAAHRVTSSNRSRKALRSSSTWIARASTSSARRSVPSGLAARNRIVCFIGGLCAGSAGYEVGVGWLSSLRLSWVQPRRSYGRRPVQESDGACGVASPQVPYLERSSAPDRGPHRRGGR